MTHFEHLLLHVPDLKNRRILDLGSGRGYFLIDAARRGYTVEGLEFSKRYIEETNKKAHEAGLAIPVVQGRGENMPYEDNSFGFINMAEVIEHVEDPEKVMEEVYRVLSPGGMAYVSVPSRYSIKDTHFHLWGINWMPRAWCDHIIGLLHRHKEYAGDAGEQRLSQMHYYAYGGIASVLKQIGFSVEDIRLRRIAKMGKMPAFLMRPVYYLLRPWYFGTHHVLLKK